MRGRGQLKINDYTLLLNSHNGKISTNLEASIDAITSSVYNLRHELSLISYNIRMANRAFEQMDSTHIDRINNTLYIIEHNIHMTETRLNSNCLAFVCQNGGTCLDSWNNFCLCPVGWEGSRCEQDINECEQFAGTLSGCQNGGICINTPGSYRHAFRLFILLFTLKKIIFLLGALV